jgi:branched-chain amino acid transport system permease protein
VNGVGRVTPDVFSLYNTSLTIIWVIVGGRGTLIGPILGAFGLFYLISWLGTQQVVNNNLVLGAILILFVLAVPRGIVPEVIRLWERGLSRRASLRKEKRLRLRKFARPAKEATH